jgi:3-hydroxy-9,10-secoandrosta-1,3,5(10)-triene-9,17-dione monooxygenase reductase component
MASQTESIVDLAKDITGRVATGLAVMTLVDSDGVRRGMTISSLTPVSADPPSVLMCIGGSASARPALVDGQSFCANILASDQVPLSTGFAWGEADPFEVFPWRPAPDGTPVLDGTAAHLLCTVEKVVEHHGTAVVLASVDDGAVNKDETLVYWRRQYFGGLVPVDPKTGGVW